MATDFNVGAGVKAPRKLLAHFVNVGTSELPQWERVGSWIESSSLDLNPNTETVTDITGITHTSVTKWEPSQSFDPFTIIGGTKLAFKLHQIWQDKTPELLSQFDVLIVYMYLDGSGSNSYEAEWQKNCTINITSIGGDAYVDMPIEITYSNDITKGTVTMADGVPTFTAAD